MKLIISLFLLIVTNALCVVIRDKDTNDKFYYSADQSLHNDLKLDIPKLGKDGGVKTVTVTTAATTVTKTAPGGFLFTETVTLSIAGPASSVITKLVPTTAPGSVTTTTTTAPGGFLFTETTTLSITGPASSVYTSYVPTTAPGSVTTTTTTLPGGFLITKTVTASGEGSASSGVHASVVTVTASEVHTSLVTVTAPGSVKTLPGGFVRTEIVTKSMPGPATYTVTSYMSTAPASVTTTTTKLPGGFLFTKTVTLPAVTIVNMDNANLVAETETLTKIQTVTEVKASPLTLTEKVTETKPAPERVTVTATVTEKQIITVTETEEADVTTPLYTFPLPPVPRPIDNTGIILTIVKNIIVGLLSDKSEPRNTLFDFIKKSIEESQHQKFDEVKNQVLLLFIVSQILKDNSVKTKTGFFPFAKIGMDTTFEELQKLIEEDE
ncbi:hypothetical protein EDC94DRAFT_624345 [Helicostylum pulchrum]|nr:hypothetical protein EDC94DRAFT_624345 [Helicostylum pulchrum]